MKDKLEKIKNDFLALIEKVADKDSLESLKTEFLGRKGKFNELMREMAVLTQEERRVIGAFANEVKEAIEVAYGEAAEKAQSAAGEAQSESEWIDVTQPSLRERGIGHLHPVSQVQQDLEDFFASMGFVVADGPELESEFFNFTALNIPPTHPARDMQDTFYIRDLPGTVMRTHTSSVQIRAMRKWGTPLRMIAPGRCFRNEATDSRHEHTFHQLEGMVIDKGITFGHLKGVLEAVAKHLYGGETKVRMRPKFYPFVEPGINGEVTCFLCSGNGCRLCKKTGWLEIFGAGMVHPKVLREGRIDPDKFTGFAFGFGLTRLVMLKYGIDDIRRLEGADVRFLNQF